MSQGGGRSPNFVVLWIIVTALWTIATVLRMQRAWVPGHSWPVVLSDPFAWISLLLPPLVFALVLIGMSRVADGHGQARR